MLKNSYIWNIYENIVTEQLHTMAAVALVNICRVDLAAVKLWATLSGFCLYCTGWWDTCVVGTAETFYKTCQNIGNIHKIRPYTTFLRMKKSYIVSHKQGGLHGRAYVIVYRSIYCFSCESESQQLLIQSSKFLSITCTINCFDIYFNVVYYYKGLLCLKRCI